MVGCMPVWSTFPAHLEQGEEGAEGDEAELGQLAHEAGHHLQSLQPPLICPPLLVALHRRPALVPDHLQLRLDSPPPRGVPLPMSCLRYTAGPAT